MNNRISDYALIGNCETAALVGRSGSIDWMCMPRFDSPACFAALLGSAENGRWQLRPRGIVRISRRYRRDTLILETEFVTSSGTAIVADFMPVGEKDPRVVRTIRVKRGHVHMHMDLVIRFDYGLIVPWVTRQKDGSLLAVSGAHRLLFRASVPIHGKGSRTVSDFVIRTGQSAHFELQYGNSFRNISRSPDPRSSLATTERFWRNWTSRCKYRGPRREAVTRSLITLKALTYAPTGGIIAAPTTSLPENPGGKRNWDYRYCWLRDATFSLLGFIHAGHHAEARKWKSWLVRCAAGSASQIQVMYGVGGERLLKEWKIPWLQGYRKSIPVRVGNSASEQLQLDIYGELVDTLYQARGSGKKRGIDFELQVQLLEHLEKIWRQPDHGIWEIRKEKRQFTHSKVMAWVAFDRAIRTAERCQLEAPLAEWKAMRQKIHDSVCQFGFDSRLGSFVRSYGSKELDANLLLLPLVGFLPVDDPRIVGTVGMIEKRLVRRGFVMRNETAMVRHASTTEGAFLPCSFWLADYYQLIGRRKDADRLLNRLLRIRNDVGLLSEEYQAEKRLLVGNFPQALSHVALVNTILNRYSPQGPARQRSGFNKLSGALL